MPRMLCVVIILAASITCLPSERIRAQESKSSCGSSCPACQDCPAKKSDESRTVEFNIPGVDFPFGVRVAIKSDVDAHEKDGHKNEIKISCKCAEVGVPFLSNVPYVNRLFKNVGPACQHSAAGVPYWSNMPKNSGVYATGVRVAHASCPCGEKKSKCSEAGCSSCPATAAKGKNQKASCGVDAGAFSNVQLAGFVEVVEGDLGRANPSEMLEEMLELRLENQRLQMEVEVVEHHLEMMEEMFDLREENAVLRTRLEFFEKHHNR